MDGPLPRTNGQLRSILDTGDVREDQTLTWRLEEHNIPPLNISTNTPRPVRRQSDPPSPHPSDYVFNPEIDDDDDDLFESSEEESDVAVEQRETRRASTRSAPTHAINVPPSPTMSSNSSISHLNWRQKIQFILHNRKHSYIGRMLRRIFTGALLISVVTMCLGTVDPILADEKAMRAVYGIEATCLVLFTIEFILQVISAPTIRDIFTFSRLLDLLCVLPFYIDIVRATTTDRTLQETAFQITGGAWVRIIDLARILRLFRVFPKSSKLRMMGTAFAHSIDGLWLLFYTIPLLIVLFASLLFYAEQTGAIWNEADRQWYYQNVDGSLERSPFQSIPDSFWLTIVTLTTIGYGDTVPQTLAGRIVASAIMIVSLFVVGFPLSMITSQYAIVADKYAQHRAMLRKERRERAERRRQRTKDRGLMNKLIFQNDALDNIKNKVKDFVTRKKDVAPGEFPFNDLGLRRAWTAPTDAEQWTWSGGSRDIFQLRKQKKKFRDTDALGSDATLAAANQGRETLGNGTVPNVTSIGDHGINTESTSTTHRGMTRTQSASSLDLRRIPTNASENQKTVPLPSTRPQAGGVPPSLERLFRSTPSLERLRPSNRADPSATSNAVSQQVPNALAVEIVNSASGNPAQESVMTVKIKLRDKDHLRQILEGLQGLM